MVRQPRDASGRFGIAEGTAEFEAFFARTQQHYTGMVEGIFQSSTPPASWPWSTVAWEHWRKLVLEHPRQRAIFDWLVALAAQGYRPHELASGQLASGSTRGIDGVVIRPPASDLEPVTWQEARRLLNIVTERKIPLDPVLRAKLDHAARGHGVDRNARNLLRAVRSAVTQVEAQRQAEAMVQQQLVTVLVSTEFTADGHTWTIGVHRVEPETVARLERWAELMTAQAAQHDWEYPIGFSGRTWPPFVIQGKVPGASKKVAVSVA
jgi:hypothetical protein